MSYQLTVFTFCVVCDSCNANGTTFASSKSRVWQTAKEAGWVSVGRKHLCSKCKDEKADS